MKQPSPNVPALKHLHGREEKKFNSKVEQIYRTKGLTSADRSNKATLLLTVPRSIQVVCKGFYPAHIVISIRGRTTSAFPQRPPDPPDVVHEPEALFLRNLTCAGTTSSFLARILA